MTCMFSLITKKITGAWGMDTVLFF